MHILFRCTHQNVPFATKNGNIFLGYGLRSHNFWQMSHETYILKSVVHERRKWQEMYLFQGPFWWQYDTHFGA